MNTLGNVLVYAMGNSNKPVGDFIFGIAFLIGFFLLITGLHRWHQASQDSAQQGILKDGFYRVLGGGILMSMSLAVGDALGTFFGLDSVFGYSPGSVGAPTTCITTAMDAGGTGTDAFTCVAKNIATNVVPAATEVLFGLMFLAGAAMFVGLLYKLATSRSYGNHGLEKGTIMKFITAVLLMNVPILFALIEGTLGISSPSITSTGANLSVLAYTPPGGGQLAQYSDLITYISQILLVFGIISVWRGINQLNHHFAGDIRDGLGRGITHIVAGVMLANGKWLAMLVLMTMYGSAMGLS